MLIKERDTSCTQISLPALTGIPFPKVLHRSETGSQVKSHPFKSFSKAFFIREFGIDQDLKCMYHFKQVPLPLSRGKKSIFARQILAQRVKEGTASLAAGIHPATFQKNDSRMETDQRHSADDRELACLNVSFVFIKVPLMLLVLLLLFCLQLLPQGPRLVSGQGLLGPDSTEETQRIHRENQAKLQGMSESEILQEQTKLLSQLGRLFC